LFQHHPFYKQHEQESENQQVAAWIRQVCRPDSDSGNDNEQRSDGGGSGGT